MYIPNITAEQRAELAKTVSRITSENLVSSFEEQGELKDADKRLIELCSAVSATAISITLQLLQEQSEEHHPNSYH